MVSITHLIHELSVCTVLLQKFDHSHMSLVVGIEQSSP